MNAQARRQVVLAHHGLTRRGGDPLHAKVRILQARRATAPAAR